jgi:hypothetical protein
VNRNQKFFLWVSASVALFLLLVLVIETNNRTNQPSMFTPIPSATRSEQITRASATSTPAQAIPDRTQTNPVSPTTTLPKKQANEFFVSPDGSANNDGSQEKPWSLEHVLDQPEALKPGDTVWIRGGKYDGKFSCSIKGEEGKPIILRAYPGERAILENHDDLVLDIANSSYVYFWGLEITSINNTRDPYNRPEGAYGIRINQGKKSDHIKFINLIIHDMPAQGIGWWQANKDSDLYGSVIFYNGVNQFDHGVYVHNDSGTKRITDNIIFDNASHGIHAYGENQNINNISLEGNTLFNNGSIGFSTTLKSYGVYKRNILVGAKEQVAENPVITNNFTYYPGNQGIALNLGYDAGSTNAIVESNYFAGGKLEVTGKNAGMQMMKNFIVGIGITSLDNIPFAGNELLVQSREMKVFVRPNLYERGRANITIYNWAHQDTIRLSDEQLSSLRIKKGDKYELHNVQDYFSDIIRGQYNGSDIEVPMTGHSVAQPQGLNFKPASTFPEFGAFVLFVVPAGMP